MNKRCYFLYAIFLVFTPTMWRKRSCIFFFENTSFYRQQPRIPFWLTNPEFVRKRKNNFISYFRLSLPKDSSMDIHCSNKLTLYSWIFSTLRDITQFFGHCLANAENFYFLFEKEKLDSSGPGLISSRYYYFQMT